MLVWTHDPSPEAWKRFFPFPERLGRVAEFNSPGFIGSSNGSRGALSSSCGGPALLCVLDLPISHTMGGPFLGDHGNQHLLVISRNAFSTINMYQTDTVESKQKQDRGKTPRMLLCALHLESNALRSHGPWARGERASRPVGAVLWGAGGQGDSRWQLNHHFWRK